MSQRVALIVGINQYDKVGLRNLTASVNDATAMQKLFKEYSDFQVIPLPLSGEYLSLEEFRNQFNAVFSQKDNAPTDVLFYFSGHGVVKTELDDLTEEKTKTYYLSLSDKKEALNLASLCSLIEESAVRNIVIILDCCHSGELYNFIESFNAKRFCLIAASASETEALARKNKQGLLTEIILQALDPNKRNLDDIKTSHLVEFVNQYPNKPPTILPPAGVSYDFFTLTRRKNRTPPPVLIIDKNIVLQNFYTKRMNRETLYQLLTDMLPAQLQEVCFHYPFPSKYQSSEATAVRIATDLIQFAENKNDLKGLIQTVHKLFGEQLNQQLRKLQAQSGAVSAGLSCSLHSESEKQWVRWGLQWFRSLSKNQQQNLPQMLDGLARLELAVGDFAQAEQLFQELTTNQQHQNQATALYNQHRALLEQRKFDAALKPLLQAGELDPPRFKVFRHRYLPQKILGAGGFGTVFLCHDSLKLNTPVVIKVLQTEQLAQQIEAIFHEALLLKQLNHPHIIRIEAWDYAHEETRSNPYLELEYFPGESLQTYIQQHGTLSPEAVLVLARLLAEALAQAHQQSILHRDLKPANILVLKDGENWQLKLIDFGLGIRQQAHRGHTLLGRSLTGTLDYAPPEQKGEMPSPVGTYSDVYSFGLTLYYALFKDPRPSLRQSRRLDGHALLEILEDCTEREPEKRLQDFTAVLAALKNLPDFKNLEGLDGQQQTFVQNQQALGSQKYAHYIAYDDGTVLDIQTGLLWMRCALRQTWNGKTCVGQATTKATTMSWDKACQQTGDGFAGYQDWRIPTIEELKTLVDMSQSGTKIHPQAFPNCPAYWFWSGSPYPYGSNNAWGVDFNLGNCDGGTHSYNFHVRLVRGGQ